MKISRVTKGIEAQVSVLPQGARFVVSIKNANSTSFREWGEAISKRLCELGYEGQFLVINTDRPVDIMTEHEVEEVLRRLQQQMPKTTYVAPGI